MEKPTSRMEGTRPISEVNFTKKRVPLSESLKSISRAEETQIISFALSHETTRPAHASTMTKT